MQVARVLFPVTALGPGRRVGIWVCGCRRRCPMCANPELQAFAPEKNIKTEELIRFLEEFCRLREVEGVTISGGEPFEQTKDLRIVTESLSKMIPDILVFSGYTLEQLRERKDPCTDAVLRSVAVLIDGDYQDELNTGSVLRGSDNQNIYIFRDDLRERYERYLLSGRQYQTFETSEGIFSVGLHRRGFMDEFKKRLEEKMSSGSEEGSKG